MPEIWTSERVRAQLRHVERTLAKARRDVAQHARLAPTSPYLLGMQVLLTRMEAYGECFWALARVLDAARAEDRTRALKAGNAALAAAAEAGVPAGTLEPLWAALLEVAALPEPPAAPLPLTR